MIPTQLRLSRTVAFAFSFMLAAAVLVAVPVVSAPPAEANIKASQVDFAVLKDSNQGFTENRFVGIREASRNYRYLGSYAVKTDKFNRRLQVYCADPEQSSAGDYHDPVTIDSFHRNDGVTVGSNVLSRVNYVVSTYGGTTVPRQSAAVGAAVYHLLGYPRRNLNDTSTTSYRDAEAYGVLALAKRYINEAGDYAGQWRMTSEVLQDPSVVGDNLRVRATVVSARTGEPIPDVKVVADYAGDNRASKSERTGNQGRAVFDFNTPKNGRYKVSFSVVDTPDSSVYVARPKRAGSQRMFVGGSRRDLSSSKQVQVRQPSTPPDTSIDYPDTFDPEIETLTSSPQIAPGESLSDLVMLNDFPGDYEATLRGRLYGPYNEKPTASQCLPGDPVAGNVAITASGDGEYMSPEVEGINQVGWYTWVWDVPGFSVEYGDGTSFEWSGITTACGIDSETTVVKTQPVAETQVSDQDAVVGAEIHDTVILSGSEGVSLNGEWQLHGPVALPAGSTSCMDIDWSAESPAVAASGAWAHDGDGSFQVGNHVVNEAGCYTYTTSINETDFSEPFDMTPLGIESETTLVRYAPEVETVVSEFEVSPGTQVHDTVTVTGAGDPATAPQLTAEWALYGPATPVSGSCLNLDWTGVQLAANGTFPVQGDGDYVVGHTTIEDVGCYTYTERFTESEYSQETPWHEIGIESETTVSKTTPTVTTNISSQEVSPGAVITDSVTVTGLHGQSVEGEWRLHGPIVPDYGQPCVDVNWDDSEVHSEGTFSIESGHDEYTATTDDVTIDNPGCYTYTAKVNAGDLVNEVDWHDLGLSDETTISRTEPAVSTKVIVDEADEGVTVRDEVTIDGLGEVPATGTWVLYGPAQPTGDVCAPERIDWSDADVVADGTFTANGDGKWLTDELNVTEPGCYTYGVGLDATGVSDAVAEHEQGIPDESFQVEDVPAPEVPEDPEDPKKPEDPEVPELDIPSGVPAESGDRGAQVGAIALSVMMLLLGAMVWTRKVQAN